MPIRAKVFKTGGSQAVRLPKEFRFEGDEVEISRQGQRVVLEPVRKVWSDQFRLLHGSMPDFKLPPEPAPAEAGPDFD
ncbi:MAG: AbrB/MazE/SpoVT family DNA-binding domain-containing protein [Acidobacteria bacterium]|nr:AbrB/MazE/SpoVT family DNA-binding domain-containing protein [Acidobacteriota bacterium]